MPPSLSVRCDGTSQRAYGSVRVRLWWQKRRPPLLKTYLLHALAYRNFCQDGGTEEMTWPWVCPVICQSHTEGVALGLSRWWQKRRPPLPQVYLPIGWSTYFFGAARVPPFNTSEVARAKSEVSRLTCHNSPCEVELWGPVSCVLWGHKGVALQHLRVELHL